MVLVAVLVGICCVMAGCNTTKCIPTTEYIRHDSIITKYQTDSVRVMERDSVFVREKGDTIWLTRWKYIEREHISNKVDTIYRDRVNTVVQTKVERYVPAYYKWCSWIVWILFVIIIARIVWMVGKKYLQKHITQQI